MKSPATIASLQICPGPRQPMMSVESARAVENLGLEGDRHAKPDSKRQVLLVEAETLERFGLRIGDVKENVTTRGIALMELPIGAQLRVGEAVLEITGACHPCQRMDELRPGLRQEMDGQRGMLARVAQSGALRVGDVIVVEAPSSA
jgi:MOSC domain-containing protein YiiM